MMNGAIFDIDEFDDTYANGAINGTVDPAFRKIQKNQATFLIWRIESLTVVPVPKEQYGTFYDSDSYIIFAASQYGHPSGPNSICRELRCGAEYHIHFWLGKSTSADKAGTAAYKTVELDGYIGGNASQHREVQGSESPRFKSYFNKTGMTILSGGTNAALKPVTDSFGPTLYKVKGKRAPIITQMPDVSWKHFNSGDVFLLRSANSIFVWVGRAANHTEKLHAAKAAMSLKVEHEVPNIVFVDDGYEKTLHESDLKDFEVHLSLEKRNVRPADDEAEDDKAEQNYRNNIKLYQCSDSSGKYRVTEVKSGPLKQSDLSSDDVFILDHNIYGIWVWVGKRANNKERVEAMRNARGFVKKKKYPAHTAVTRVVDGAEPFEFKMLFSAWREKEESIGLVKGMIKPVAVVKVTRYDAETMYDRPALAAKSQLLDDGMGTVTKFAVKRKNNLIEHPKERNGVFFSADCYIIVYNYRTPAGEKHVMYYWLGIHSTQDEQATALIKILEMKEELGCLHIGRIVQGYEPPHFLQTFKGRMRTFVGKGMDFDPSGKNLKTPSHYLLQIKGSTTYNSKGHQVALKATSLDSNYCFVLRKGSHYYVWCGQYTNGDNREIAKAFAGSDFELILEGNESPEFWHVIGGKDTYMTEKIITEKSDSMPARLFQCSSFTGQLKCEEILNFTQHDLTPEDVLFLDAGNVIFIWIGRQHRKDERDLSLQTAIEYLKSDPTERSKHTHIQQITQGAEPPTFTGFFDSWDSKFWTDYKNYNQLREEIEKSCSYKMRANMSLLKMPDEFDQYPKYPISVLIGPVDSLPLSVDPLKKEVHLTYDDFLTVTKMIYSDFKNLPFWKQQEIKKKVGLF